MEITLEEESVAGSAKFIHLAVCGNNPFTMQCRDVGILRA